MSWVADLVQRKDDKRVHESNVAKYKWSVEYAQSRKDELVTQARQALSDGDLERGIGLTEAAETASKILTASICGF